MKVLIIDRIGIHSGTQYYNYFFKSMFDSIPGCTTEIISNFNVDEKPPVLLNIFEGSSLRKALALLYTFFQLFFKALLVRRPVYIYMNYGTFVDNLLLMALAPAKRRIIDIHELIPKEGNGRFNQLLFKLAFKTINNSIIHSESTKQSLKDYGYKGHYFYVPLYESSIRRDYIINNVGIDIQKAVVPGKINLLFFGSLTFEKGVDLLIDSVNLLSEETKQLINVVIAGRAIDDAINIFQSSDSVFHKVIRHIADDELIFLFSKCDYVCIPYRATFQSGVMDRAFDFKKPVLTTKLPYFIDMLEKYPSFGRVADGCDSISYGKLIEAMVEEDHSCFYNDDDVMKFNKKEGVDDFIEQMTSFIRSLYGYF